MSRTPKRPANVVVEPVRARVVRGPRPDGSWYWRAVVYQGNQGDERTIWTGWGRRDEVNRILVDLVASEGLDTPPDEPAPVETVRDLLEHWVAAQEQRPKLSTSAKRTARLAGTRICATIGDVRLDRLNIATVERYRDEQLRLGLSTATVALDLKKFASAWRWGAELGWCPDRQLPRVQLEVRETRDKRTPTRDEVLKVLAVLDGWPRLLVLLLFATGARISELARLTWADVDLGSATIRLRETKNGEHRDVPLHADTVAELRAIRPDDLSAGVFGVKPSTVRYNGGDHIHEACLRAGVIPFTPHGHRRLAVDTMIDGGVKEKVAASVTGHSIQVMLRYYRRAATDADRREAVKATGLGQLVQFPGRRKAEGDDQ